MSADIVADIRGVAVGRGEPVLADIDLEIARGEIVALIGASGCGKSTLMRTLGGLARPLAGEVRLFGEPLYDLDSDRRAAVLRRVGYAFQQDALFSSLTIEDNVALPLRELAELPEAIAREMVRIKLAMVGIAELAGRLPSHLSGGQRKRAALARASILDPELLLCDEPTAGLDPVTTADIDRTLRDFRDVLGTTIVVVSHEIASVREIANRVVMFEGGGIRAAGTLDELADSSDRVVHEFLHARSA